ncbi:hypothetical protein NQ314_000069 [Rhamnusium bicolor]|uniref:RNA-directed DNA polymerase n=1 Tax=Rhamnusium bicolor TaxID=1586634 RepID=A0AAV8ZZA6_9CUCU|nr:hypothetical protein NQ314_000069 [Rhamnusium bicolor]
MLQEYRFTVTHVPGPRNELPDFLSRNPITQEVPAECLQDDRMYPELHQTQEYEEALYQTVIRSQRFDEGCTRDKARLWIIQQEGPADEEDRRVAKKYVVLDDLIWFRKHSHRALLVPTEMRPRILDEYHESRLAGHPGRDETQRAIQRLYHWPGVNKDIKTYVRTCLVCASEKRGAPQGAAPQRPHVPEQPWKTISLDVLGPYRETKEKNRFVMVATDLFTKWVEAKPTQTSTIRSMIQFLEEEVFHRWGFPEQIITDNGPQFRSNVWRRYLTRQHLTHFTAPIYQRANPVERRVQELKKVLRTKEPREKWDQHLSEALYNLRTRTNAATGTSPSELLLGHVLPRPGDWAVPLEAQPPPPPPRKDRVRRARDRQVIYQRRLFPRPREPQLQFKRGDQVMARNHQPGHPLDKKWTGPPRGHQEIGRIHLRARPGRACTSIPLGRLEASARRQDADHPGRRRNMPDRCLGGV